ncbi:copper resistance CopC/CopD family protein [Tianweitania sediminis]|uniref:Copper resistance protein CopC/CopD n=1 Tax=Tianweitania sediminis TaxID=1502156 RepID=A0A8J7QWQ8_9HYPH|nr:copper resistance protein CopC [Tianweitania sediminis]MBP0438038.1 copper resistance protein CopC/CopD [Tianweitania sediminis]
MALLPSPALAHAVLVSSDPLDGSSVQRMPSEVVLRFSEPVAPVKLRLAGSAEPLPELHGTQTADNGIRVPLPDDLGQGSYVLSYNVTSLDGHPVAGAISFGVGTSAAIAPAQEAAGGIDLLAALVRALHYGSLLAATGGGLFVLLVLKGEHVPRALLRGLLTFAALAATTLVLLVGLNGLQLTGLPFPGLLTREPWIAGAGTTLLRSAMAGVAGLLLLVVGLLQRLSRWDRLVVGGGSLLALASLPLTGHAAIAPPASIAAPAVYIHGVAAAFWTGSLWPLWIMLPRMSPVDGVRMVDRFSSLAIGLVVVLILAGSLLSFLQMGSPDAVFTTPYGWTWALKICLVLPLLGLAALNRQVLLPNLARRGPLLLRRSLVAETVLIAAIIMATSMLGQTPPPRAFAGGQASAGPTEAAPTRYEARSGQRNLALMIHPGALGQNHVSAQLSDADGKALAVQEVTTAWSLPSSGIEALERPLAKSPEGEVSGTVDLPLGGDWVVQVEVLVSDFEKAVFRLEVQIAAH